MSSQPKHHPAPRKQPSGIHPRHPQRGAAFLIAIAILVILVAVGTTFFSVSRLELKSATNVTNAVRVDLLNDAANTIAIHHLNQYFFRSPDVTAADHSYRSLFNGSAFAGKSWARRKDATNDPFNPAFLLGRSMLAGGVPEIDINRIQRALDAAAGRNAPVVLYWPEDGHKEQLFRGSRSNNWLYIPRFQSALYGTGFDPFYPIVNNAPVPDFILLYDYDGKMDDLRRNPIPDSAPRRIELRVEDGGGPDGQGTVIVQNPTQLAALNAAIASLDPSFRAGDIQLQYISDLDPFNDGNPEGRQFRYPFVTASLYKDFDNPDNYGAKGGEVLNPNVGGYPVEQVHAFADVDNDGDGFRDAIWIPIPEDIYFPDDQIDNDLDGMIDETQDNGINDDGDFVTLPNGNIIPRTDYEDWNLDGTPVTDPIDGIINHDPDESIEAGTFLYHGLGPLVEIDGQLIRVGDGFDNDGNGLVDDPAEDRLFLTAPLPGTRIPLDLDGDGIASGIETFRPLNGGDGLPLSAPYRVINPAVILPQTIFVSAIDPVRGRVNDIPLTAVDVDVLDNDYDLLVNDFYAYAYLGPYLPIDLADPLYGWRHQGNWVDAGPEFATPGKYATQILKSYDDIARRVWFDGVTFSGTVEATGVNWFSQLDAQARDYLLASVRVTHSGEPVCDIVGRAAITITDEASKINLNVAGAETLNPFPVLTNGPMQPAFNQGVGPHEYDLSTLPDIGVALASKIAGYRTGGPGGRHLPRDTDTVNVQAASERILIGNLQGAVGGNLFDYVYDVSLPGYGRVDDNGDALLRTLDGRDNNGNGILGEGLISPADLPAAFDEVLDYFNGNIPLEGIADPAQLAFARKWYRLGSFEGIDEPTERQAFNPLRNEIAESDQIDNDGPYLNAADSPFTVTDEVGELGDRVFQAESELANVSQIGGETLGQVTRFTTTYSTDRNVSFIPTETGLRALNKTDINRASVKQLAAKLLLSSGVSNPLRLVDTLGALDVLDNTPLEEISLTNNWSNQAVSPVRFADGLRQANTRLTAFDPTPANNSGDTTNGGFLFHRRVPSEALLGGAIEFPLDQVLEYMQLSASIMDNRDGDHGRSELTTEIIDSVQKTSAELGLGTSLLPPGAEYISPTQLVGNWPRELSPQRAIAEADLFPLEEIQNHFEDVLGVSAGARQLQITDRWWLDRVASNVDDPNSNVVGATLPEQRLISYTSAGVESIRINELMVRPVRRVEAEALPNAVLADDPFDPIDNGLSLVQKRNLDPSPFAEQVMAVMPPALGEGDRIGAYPHPATAIATTTTTYIQPGNPLMPEFSITRRVLETPVFSNGITGSVSLADTTWGLDPNSIGVLGDRTALATEGFARELILNTPPTTTPFLVPDVMEFTFSDINDLGGQIIKGLPDGRYYLKVKLENLNDDLRQAVSRGRLRYAIKYFDTSLAPTPPLQPVSFGMDQGILEDIAELLVNVDANPTPLQLDAYRSYFERHFRSVPPQHLANGPGEPDGWVFLDATPANAINLGAGYFRDFPASYHVSFAGQEARVVVDFDPATGTPYAQVTGDAIALATSVQLRDTGTVPDEPADIVFTPSGNRSIRQDITRAQLSGLMVDNYYELFINGVLAAPLQRSADDTLSTHAVYVPPLNSGYVLSVALTTSNLPGNSAPPADPLAPGGSQEPGGSIGVNFFDFSQEPDHEYVEVANISDDEIDLSGWELHVGPPKKEGVEYTPFSTEWKVPEGVRISPGGMLLFAFNKFDSWDNVGATPSPRSPDANRSLIQRNGLGLARTNADVSGDNLPDLSRVTVPPIFDNSSNPNLYDPNLSFYFDLTGSVFERSGQLGQFIDYVDDFGAGVTTARANALGLEMRDPAFEGLVPDQQRVALEAVLQSDPRGPRFNPDATGSLVTSDYPWDRIIELDNVRLWQKDDSLLDVTSGGNVLTMRDIDDVDALARMVLRGGILPNYPEQDGYDNDGDGGYIASSASVSYYVPGILEEDMLDNDLDGFTDERAVNIDIDGDGDIDLPVWPFSGEGVDEGRLGLLRVNTGFVAGVPEAVSYRAYGAGSFEFGTLPAIFNISRLEQETFFNGFNLNADPSAIDQPVFNNNALLVVDTVFDELIPQPAFALANAPYWQITNVPGFITVTSTPTLTIDVAAGYSTGYTEVAELSPSFAAIVSRQSYFVSWEIESLTAGSIRMRVGDSLFGPANAPINTRVTVSAIVLAEQAGGLFSAPSVRIEARGDIATQAVINNIRIIPINTSNTHGSSFAAGVSGDVLIPRVEGNANQFIGTALGQTYGTEPDLLNNGGLPVVGRGSNEQDALYLGSDRDPADWKAFVERRMYPGDNVVVSLYTRNGDVADRVTYREYDVVNRTVDDLVASPYVTNAYHDLQPMPLDEGVLRTNPNAAPYASLHPDYPTFWLPNHMGLDFYRSLERKSPLDTGDKFGTQNRWQATDGNYDDWADSLSVFARSSLLTNSSYAARPLLPTAPGGLPEIPDPDEILGMSRFYEEGLMSFNGGFSDTEDHLRLYGHALWGTPLRMNTAHRHTANPIDPQRLADPTTGLVLAGLLNVPGTATQGIRQFYQTGVVNQVVDAQNEVLALNLWQQLFADTPVLNDSYTAPLDMARVPHITKEHHMMNLPLTASLTTSGTYLHDDTRMNMYTNAGLRERPVVNIAQRSVLAYHREPTTENEPRPMTDLLNAGATDNITLTVAQANFIPIMPTANYQFDLDPSVGAVNLPPDGLVGMAAWRYASTDPDVKFNTPGEPPAMWSPVFLFAFPQELDTATATTGGRRFPAFPPDIAGRASAPIVVDPTAVLFNPDFFFTQDWVRSFFPDFPATTGAGNARSQVLNRWPLEKRVAMYVSKRRNISPGVELNAALDPEALWVWDEEDGLENGEYEVYIGTHIAGLASALEDTINTVNAVAVAAPDLVTNLALPATSATLGNAFVTQFAQKNIAARDPSTSISDPAGNTINTSDPFSASYEIEILTDRTEALGVRPAGSVGGTGLIPSSEWKPGIAYRANADGYIYFGADAADGWQPIIVRVTDNFLALRMRNVGTTTETGALSHVVLSPRKRTPGRMNINTAQFQVADATGGSEQALIHPMAGLPGILDLGGQIPMPLLTDDRELITNPARQAKPTDGSLAEPYAMRLSNSLLLGNTTAPVPGLAMPPQPNPFGILDFEAGTPQGTLGPLLQADPNNLEGAFKASRYLLLSMLQLGRTEYADGRYYTSPSDLLSEKSGFDPVDFGTGELFRYPLSNNSDAERRAQESLDRFRRIAASISVRSDVFEIIATVQSGYGIDADNDGRVNYRNSNEFITTAETRTRLVYERRAPADNSDIADVAKQ